MRSIRCAVAAALAITAGSSIAGAQAQPAPFKVAYVNSEVLLSVAPGRAAAESTFQAEAQGYQAQVQAMSDSLNKVVAAYQKREATLTAAQKQTQQQAIQNLQSQFEAKNQQIQQEANQRQTELMTPVMETVKKVIEDIRVEDGYSLVLDNAPSGSPIVAADKNLDITDRVVARLRATKAPTLPTATPQKPANAAAPVGVTRKPPTQ